MAETKTLPCQLAVDIAYCYFQQPFDGDPDTLARIADEAISRCAEPADYCALAGDCDRCLNPTRCICQHHCPDEDEPDTNVRLIAAAPDLYRACKLMQASLNGSPSNFVGMLAAHRQLDAAIALVDKPADESAKRPVSTLGHDGQAS